MTSALTQNTDANNIAINMLIKANESTSTTPKVEADSKFSNIINNIEARSNKAQKEFDKNTKITNTSSINQKILNKKEITHSTKKDIVAKEAQNEAQETNLIDQKSNVETEEKNIVVSKTTTTKEKEVSIEKDEQIKNEINYETKETEEKNTQEKLSDINNSSPVESSPVFSSDEIQLNKEDEIKIESALKDIQEIIKKEADTNLLAQATIVTEKPQQETTVEENNVELNTIDEINKAVDEISTYLDNANINQEAKEQILNTINEIKNVLSDNKNQTDSTIDFEKTLTDIKEKVSQIIKIETSKINPEDIEKLDETLNKINIDNRIQSNTEDFNNNSGVRIELVKEIEDTVKKLSKDLNETIDLKDINKLKEISKELPKLIENIKNTFEETSEFSEELTKSFENFENVLSEALDKKDSFIVENIASDDFKNLKIENKQITNEILNVLENINSKLDIQENEEIKTQVEDLIKKINSGEISIKQLTKAIDDISDEIKSEIKSEIETNIKTETTIENVFKINNAIKASNEFDSSKNNEQTNDFSQSKVEPRIENSEIQDMPEFEFKQEIQLKANISKDTNTEINTKPLEKNLQKAIAIQDMLEDMIVEVDIKTIPVQSGALSVADEITKLAMGENNTLNSISSSNTITYDSTGINAVIKNIANLTKTTQAQAQTENPSMEDLINQVTNKITQLKDSSTQKLTMVLRPNDLGRLQIELVSNQNGLTTQIMAQNEQVRAYIEKNIDSLRTQLAENGVNVNAIQIKTAGSDGTTTYDGNQNLTRQQEENLNQENNRQNHQHEQKNDNKDAKEILASITNYDTTFAKDFSNILNKSLKYSLN